MKIVVQDIQYVDREIEVEFPVYRKTVHDMDNVTVTTFHRIDSHGIDTELVIWDYFDRFEKKYEFSREKRPMADFKSYFEETQGSLPPRPSNSYRWMPSSEEEFKAQLAELAGKLT